MGNNCTGTACVATVGTISALLGPVNFTMGGAAAFTLTFANGGLTGAPTQGDYAITISGPALTPTVSITYAAPQGLTTVKINNSTGDLFNVSGIAGANQFSNVTPPGCIICKFGLCELLGTNTSCSAQFSSSVLSGMGKFTGNGESFTVKFDGSANPQTTENGVDVKATYSSNVYIIDVTPPAPTVQTSVQFINNTGTSMSVPASSILAMPASANSCVSCASGSDCVISGSDCNVTYSGTFPANTEVEFTVGLNNFTVNFDGASSTVPSMSGVNAVVNGFPNTYVIKVTSVVTVSVNASFTGSLAELLFNGVMAGQYKNIQMMGFAPIVITATLDTTQGNAILKSMPISAGFSPSSQNLIPLDSTASSFRGTALSGEINAEYTNDRVNPILILSSVGSGSNNGPFILDPNLTGSSTTVELVGTKGMNGASVTITESSTFLQLAAYYSFAIANPAVTSALTYNMGTVSNNAFSFTFVIPTSELNNPISATGTISLTDSVSNNTISFTFNNWQVSSITGADITASIYGLTATVTSAELNLTGDTADSYPTLTISGSLSGPIPQLYYNNNISGTINLTFED